MTRTLFSLIALVPVIFCSRIVQLRDYSFSAATKISDVDDGALLYLASSDKALTLSRITLSSHGQTTTLQKLLANVDDSGIFQKGWPVDSDLKISTTNSAEQTDQLEGIMFISSAAQAKDPNFLVYVVNDQTVTIDRATSNETTLVLLNKRVNLSETDPKWKSYYNTRVDSIVQPSSSELYMYNDIPRDGYTDLSHSVTMKMLIFANPMKTDLKTNMNEDKYFFDNIEPIQFYQLFWYIRSIGGIKFNVSQKTADQAVYTTTNATTTGFTMSTVYTYNTTVNLKNNPNHDGKSGYRLTTQLFSNLTLSLCSGDSNCHVDKFFENTPVFNDLHPYDLNSTNFYVQPGSEEAGSFYIQYYRIEGRDLSDVTPGATNPPSTSSTTASSSNTSPPSTTLETSTKGVAATSFSTIFLCQIAYLLRV